MDLEQIMPEKYGRYFSLPIRSRIVPASDVALRQPGERLIKTILSYRYATNIEFRVREIEKEIT